MIRDPILVERLRADADRMEAAIPTFLPTHIPLLREAANEIERLSALYCEDRTLMQAEIDRLAERVAWLEHLKGGLEDEVGALDRNAGGFVNRRDIATLGGDPSL